MAVRQPSDSGTAIINRWIQNGEQYDLALSSSFLGMGSTRLKGVPGFIEFTLPNGETYRLRARKPWSRRRPAGSCPWRT